MINCPTCGSDAWLSEGDDHPNGEALRKAAPELLEACKYAMDWAQANGVLLAPSVEEQLEQAIAKAKGE